MSSETQDIREDLAFLRALVQAGDDYRRPFGEAYLAAGVCYLGQVALGLAQMLGWLGGDPVTGISVGVAPTAIFLGWLAFILVRHRGEIPNSPTGRAIGGVFGAVGLANLVLVVVIGSVAWRERSFATWLIYPCAAFVLQGAAWLVANVMTRRGWMMAVALVWFACAVGMALTIWSTLWFVAFVGLGLGLGMAAPGVVMMRAAVRAA